MSRPLSWTMRDHKEIPTWAITAVEKLEHKLEQAPHHAPETAPSARHAALLQWVGTQMQLIIAQGTHEGAARIAASVAGAIEHQNVMPQAPLGGETATSIRAAERERCALLCDDYARIARANGASGSSMALTCADRIRVSELTAEELRDRLAEGQPVRSTTVTTPPQIAPPATTAPKAAPRGKTTVGCAWCGKIDCGGGCVT